MDIQKNNVWSRREFVRALSLAGSAGLLGLWSKSAAAEPPPETTTIRLIFDPDLPALCYAPQFVAEQFLHLEGFTDVRYVPYGADSVDAKMLMNDMADVSASFGTGWIDAIDDGAPIVVLGGLHIGCTELFASEGIRTIGELKGKRVAVSSMGGGSHVYLSSVVAYIGLDPSRDIEWVVASPKSWSQMLAEGKVDAIGTFPPMSYDVRARKIGHVVLNTTTDDPWRHYFCCMVAARSEFARNYPIATKRALRAFLKANQLCSLEPERTTQWLIDKGYASHYDYTLQTLRDIPYGAWRIYDPEDTLRFYSLRLREAGMIKHTPQEIIARGTDWRFLNELKKELKA